MLEARRPWPGVWPCPDTLQSEPPNEFISSLGLSCPGVQPSSALTDSKSAGDSLPPQDCSPGALGAGRPRPSLAPLPDSCRPLITAAAVTLIAFTHLLGKHIVNMGGCWARGPPACGALTALREPPLSSRPSATCGICRGHRTLTWSLQGGVLRSSDMEKCNLGSKDQPGEHCNGHRF